MAGYGICGHKNTFSTSVRHGNWIEDSFGRDLASSTHVPKFASETESSSRFIDPTSMPADNSAGSRFVASSLRPNGSSLHYNTLFKHGDEVIPSPQLRMTQVAKEVLKKRQDRLDREKHEMDARVPESRRVGESHQYVPFRVRTPEQPAPLPSFRRKNNFSQREHKEGRHDSDRGTDFNDTQMTNPSGTGSFSANE